MTVKAFSVLLLASLALGSSVAHSRESTGKTPTTVLGQKFPSIVAGYKAGDMRDYESKTPGLGYSFSYQRGPREWADVYVYNMRRNDIPAGYDPSVSAAELAVASGDIARAVQAGAYRSATARGNFTVPASGKPRLDCDRFLIVAKDGEERDSIACVTNRSGKFIKIRLDGPAGSLAPQSAAGFLRAWVKP